MQGCIYYFPPLGKGNRFLRKYKKREEVYLIDKNGGKGNKEKIKGNKR